MFTLTEKENWVGPDGVLKNKVMLINSRWLGRCAWEHAKMLFRVTD